MSRFFISLLLFAFGFLVMKYAWQIEQWTGRSDWGKYFGGTNNMIKLVGLVFIVLSLLNLFGIFEFNVNPSLN